MKIAGGQERNYFAEIIDFISARGRFVTYNGGRIEYGNKSQSSIKLA